MLAKPPFLWFLLPTAFPDPSLSPLLSCTSPSVPQLPAPYTPAQPSQNFNPFFPHCQPLIDLPNETTASHHFPFPLLLRLFCWSIRVGEEEWEMRVGDRLSPCQVAVQRRRGVRRARRGLEICWTHEKLATLGEGADPEGRPDVDVISAHHLANAAYAKNWKAGEGSTGLSSC